MVTGVHGPCVGNIQGIPRVGFKGLCLQDGPLSIRQVSYSSVFPAGLTAAATWDRNLIYQRGEQMGAEFKSKGANVILGYVDLNCCQKDKAASHKLQTSCRPTGTISSRRTKLGRILTRPIFDWRRFLTDDRGHSIPEGSR
jgi:hypothetical protein